MQLFISMTYFFFQCFDLQEFVYGSKDPRTCQTRNALDLLKKYAIIICIRKNI